MVRRGLAVLLLCASLGSCAGLRRCGTRQRDFVKVRWPVTGGGKEAAQRRVDALAPDEELSPRPGVQVRAGRAVDLDFLEVVLGEAGFDDRLPLVVLLHGRGDRPRLPGGPFARLPGAVRVLLPRGPRPLGKGFSWLPVSITSGRIDELTAALRTRANHLAAFIAWALDHRPTIGRPIVSGFSQGGMLSFVLATLRPEVVSVALPMAGWLPPGLMPAAGPPPEVWSWIRAAHGDADRVIPVEPTRQVVERLRGLGWDAELEVFPGVAHVVDRRMNQAFELWLEEALRAQAPDLGRGLGGEGSDDTDDEEDDVELLDDETIQAIDDEELELSAPVDAEPEGAGGGPSDEAEGPG